LARTPLSLFNKLDARFNFTIDCAADATNHLCPIWYHDFFKEDIHFGKGVAWCNCPYSRGSIDRFIKKCYEESLLGATVVMLLPSDTSTKYFRDYCMKASEIIFIQPRVKFNNPDGTGMPNSPKFGSMVVVFKQSDFYGSPVISCMGWK
jgi:phage N-6-adenine-methyltransferase